MKRHMLKLLLAVGAALTLSGCFSHSVDELYTLPKLPEDYTKLQEKIEQVLAVNSAESAAPLTGELSQPVQLQDLDGDGIEEAIAFFRVTADERPLKIYIYRQVGEDYEVASVIENAGAAINSVAYENVDDTPAKEIIVSWQMSEKVYSLAAYSVSHNLEVVELLRTDYTNYQIFDVDMDNQKELIVLQSGEGGGDSWVDLYNFHGVLELESSAPLSQNITDLVDVKTGYLENEIPAVFVASLYGVNGHITDIFAWRDGQLQNITLDPETRESVSTIRWYTQVPAADINGDGVLELPAPYALPDPTSATTAVNFWAIRWRSFDINGRATEVFTTYQNVRDGWYFILPEEWYGKITLSRSDQAGGGERAVIFSYWEEGSGQEPEPFLTIYQLNGDNRLRRAQLPGRFRLLPEAGSSGDVIYAARLMDCSWDCGLDEAGVQERFALITN